MLVQATNGEATHPKGHDAAEDIEGNIIEARRAAHIDICVNFCGCTKISLKNPFIPQDESTTSQNDDLYEKTLVATDGRRPTH